LTTNLYVTSKVRAAYERDTGILTPAQVIVLGDPGKKSVYGITRLSIEKSMETDSESEYTVSFYMWLPLSAEPTENPENDIPLSVYRYKDIVDLKKQKDQWKIISIQNKQRTLVEGNAKFLLDTIAKGKAETLDFAPSSEELNQAKQEQKEQLELSK